MTTATQRDYYDVLGVPHDADDKTIKAAFRRLALKYHPDRSTEPRAEERFKEISEAYAVLSDPRKRADYDAHGFAGGVTPEDLWSGIDLGDLFGRAGMPGFDMAGGLFERLFGRRRPTGPPRGPDVEVDLVIPLERVLTGGEENVSLTYPGRCGTCAGSGAASGTKPRSCSQCGGTGQQVSSSRRGNVLMQTSRTCTVCHGRGSIIDAPCRDCGGSGEVEQQETVTVHIPQGIEDGATLRVPGHGLPGPVPGGLPGDAYVIVRTTADPRFVRRGADLWRSEAIDVPDAVLGTTRVVPTVDGEVSVTVPPGTQPGTVLRVAGRGLPHLGRPDRGDLNVAVTVRVPKHLDERQRRLYEQLRGHAEDT